MKSQKYLTLKVILGIAVSLIFAYITVGFFLDEQFNRYPWLILIGVFLGIACLLGFVLVKKYIIRTPAIDQNYFKKGMNETINYPTIEVSIDQLRKAVRQFSDNLPKGVYRTILVQDDNSIDFTQLAPILGGIPSKKFYMSKETYDLFEEEDKLIPIEMDLVQKAVDLYVKERKEFPMLDFDPHRRVNYYQLIQEHFLKTAPETQFYITELDGLISHIKPDKNKAKSSSQ